MSAMRPAARSCALMVALLLPGASWTPCAAQEGLTLAERKAMIIKRLEANRQAMVLYRWKTRTQVTVKGQERSTTLEQVWTDESGRLQHERLSLPEEEKQGLRGKKSRKKQDDLQEAIFLARSYLYMDAIELERFLARAQIWEGSGRGDGESRLQATGYLKNQDVVTVVVDAEFWLPKTLDVQTVFEGRPMTVSASFRRLSLGPSYPARLVITLPDSATEITIESFDHERRR